MRALLLLPLLAGCRNACQRLCVEMRDYASEECGLEFTDEQFDACIDENSRGGIRDYLEGRGIDRRPGQQLAICREWTPALREEWDCDDLEPYFDDGAGAADTSDAAADADPLGESSAE